MFTVDDMSFVAPDNGIRFGIENITTEGSRTETAAGALTTITTVNVAPTARLTWHRLSGDEMLQLCRLFKVDVPNFDSGRMPIRNIEDRVITVKTILPMGVREFECYVGDTVTATLESKAGFNDIATFDNEDYLKFIEWTNVQIELVGIGQVPNEFASWRS